MNDEVVSRDSEIVKILNFGFKSVFTIEDERTLPLLQPQTETSETVGDCKCKQRTSDEYIRKIRPNKAEGQDEIGTY